MVYVVYGGMMKCLYCGDQLEGKGLNKGKHPNAIFIFQVVNGKRKKMAGFCNKTCFENDIIHNIKRDVAPLQDLDKLLVDGEAPKARINMVWKIISPTTGKPMREVSNLIPSKEEPK